MKTHVKLLIVALLIFSGSVYSQVSLVKDIFKGTNQSGNITNTTINTIYVRDNLVLFIADDGTHGNELWRTDGTAVGTFIVKDIANGITSSNPASFTLVNGIVFFSAYNDEYGCELWKTDGTTAGTVMVKDIFVGGGGYSSNPASLIIFNGQLFFTATDGFSGTELWASDGSEAGTYRVKDIYVGSSGSTPTSLCVSNSTLFFCATNGNTGLATGYELWKSDGSPAGTVMVKDIYSGNSSSYPSYLTDLNGTLFFSANDGTNGTELWKSDGSNSGTIMVKNIATGSANSTPKYLISFNNLIYFQAYSVGRGVELWRSGGTFATTDSIDINSGTGNSNPQEFVKMGSVLFFAATTSTTGLELYRTDGTANNFACVKDIVTGDGLSSSPEIFTLGANLFLPASLTTAGNLQLYSSTGVVNNFTLVKQVNLSFSSGASCFTKLTSTTFVFLANDGTNGNELWISDGTTGNTTLIKNINGVSSSNPQYILPLNNKILFTATDTSGTELWASDGTAGNTAMIKNICPTCSGIDFARHRPVINNGYMYFSAYNNASGFELWKTDGSNANTAIIKDIFSGTSYGDPQNLYSINGKIYFEANNGTNGFEPWVSDGNSVNTKMIQELYASGSSVPNEFTQIGSSSNICFIAKPDGTNYQLYLYNGTTASVITNGNLNTNPDPFHLTSFNNKVFFIAKGTDGFTKLWSTDGTGVNTIIVKNINPSGNILNKTISGYDYSEFRFMTYKNKLYFFADDGVHGMELWRTDGTSDSTQIVADLYAGSASSYARDLFVYNGYLYFVINVNSIAKLYKSDGTASGTVVVSPEITNPSGMCIYNNLLYFISSDNGLKLTKTDGTLAGTQIVSDSTIFKPAVPTYSYSPTLAVANNTLFFAGDGSLGVELYKYVCTLIISGQPVSQNACAQSTKTFTVSANTTSVQPLEYQWLIKQGNYWIPLTTDNIYSGVNSATLTLTKIPISLDQKIFRCKVSGECGFDTTTAATLTVRSNPIVDITCSDADNKVCSTAPVTLTVTGASTYAWNPPAASGAQVIVNPTALTKYKVTGTDTYGCTAKDSITIDVFTIYNNNSISFVTHDNTTDKNKIIWEKTYAKNIKAYKILREKSNVIGEYDTAGIVLFNGLSIFTDTTSNLNYKYKIQGVDSCNSLSTISSSHKAIKLSLSLESNYNDLSWSNYEIESSSLGINSYNVYRGSNPSEMTLLTTTTQKTYRDNNPPSGPLYYQVIALTTNTYYPSYYNGDTRFPHYQVYTNMVFNGQAPQIVQQNPSICPGSELYLSIVQSAGTTYQWYKGGNMLAGKTLNYLSIPTMSINDTGSYTCAVANSFGSWVTSPVKASMKALPIVIAQPVDSWVGKDLSASFSVVATGDVPLYYKWYKNNSPLNESIAPTLGLFNITKNDEATYYCNVSNQCGSINSDTVELTIVPQICMVTVDRYNGYNSIVWERNSSKVFDHYNIYREGTVAGYYEKIGTKAYNDYTSFVDESVNPQSQAYLYKITATDILGHETDISLSAFHKTIHLLITKGVPSGYQLDWDEYIGIGYSKYKVYRSINSGAPIMVHEQASSTRTWTDPSTTTDSIRYFVAVDKTSGCKPCQLNVIPPDTIVQTVSNIMNNELKLGKDFVISINPVSQIKCEGDSVVFEVETEGLTPVYQWYKNAQEITNGGNGPRLVLKNVGISDEALYRCKCWTNKDAAYSSSAMLTVKNYPKLLTQPATAWVGTDRNAMFSFLANGTEPLSYQWYKKSTILNGKTNTELVISNVDTTSEATYKCVITNVCGSIETNEAKLVIVPQLCMVTNDFESDSNSNMLIWDRNSSYEYHHFNVYRESYIRDKYDKIGEIPYKALTTYIDTLVNPKSQAYMYKITAVDSNKAETDINATAPHKTIHLLVTQGIPKGIQLDWDEYIGFDYNTYSIYRSDDDTPFDSIYSMSSTSRTWTDYNAPMTKNLKYFVSVRREAACYADGQKKAGAGPFTSAVSNMEDNSRIKFSYDNVENATIQGFEVFPNPFSAVANISYKLDKPSDVSIKLLDLSGRQVERLVNSKQLPGNYNLELGEKIYPGLYLLRVSINNVSEIIRLVKVK